MRLAVSRRRAYTNISDAIKFRRSFWAESLNSFYKLIPIFVLNAIFKIAILQKRTVISCETKVPIKSIPNDPKKI